MPRKAKAKKVGQRNALTLTLDERIAEQLARLDRAWRDGTHSALFRAVALCQRDKRPLPDWVSNGVLSLASQIRPRGKTGRHARPEVQEREDQIHLTRWDFVTDYRDRWKALAAYQAEAQKRGSEHDPEFDFGSGTLEHAFVQVSKLLERTEARGSPETIKRSYRLVERLFRSGKGARFLFDG